jgi:hypothetical protein
VAAGYFDGAVDEVRVWSSARSLSEIRGTANAQITSPAAGLVARWSLDDGSGTAVAGSAGTSINGSIVGTGYAWSAPAPFDLAYNTAPAIPVLVAPASGAPSVPVSTATLSVMADDADGDSVTVSFFGRTLAGTAGPDFTLIGLPDTQYYTGELNGGSNAILKSQLDWILANRVSQNIPYVVQLGDCVEHGDNAGDPIEWMRADTAYTAFEIGAHPSLPDGIPYGICVGNHDQSPIGDPNGTTTYYNQYFGVPRFQGRTYYGGHFGIDNKNWFDLFSVGGMDFVLLTFEYAPTPDPAVLVWGDQVLTTYANRRAIVASHWVVNTGNPATFSTQGQAIYDALKAHSNLFLMLCGHVPGEGRRQDSFNGRTIYSVLSDYQSRANGGTGWLRLMQFSPANNVIRVRTYSPWLDQFEADADSSSQFTLPYDMSGAGSSFQLVGTVKVPAGATASVAWPGLSGLTAYEWYATSNDGLVTTSGPSWSFTTAEAVAPTVAVVTPNGGQIYSVGQSVTLEWSASDNIGVTSVDVLLSRTGAAGPFDALAAGLANTGSWGWTVSGPASGSALIKVVAHDAALNRAEDVSDATFTISGLAAAGEAAITDFALGPVRPNPVGRAGVISFAMPRSSRVRISVLDLQGREVAVVADRAFGPGRHELSWNGTGASGRLPSGVYFLRMRVPGRGAFVRRVALLR